MSLKVTPDPGTLPSLCFQMVIKWRQFPHTYSQHCAVLHRIRSRATLDWIPWNHHPRQIFPLFNCVSQIFGQNDGSLADMLVLIYYCPMNHITIGMPARHCPFSSEHSLSLAMEEFYFLRQFEDGGDHFSDEFWPSGSSRYFRWVMTFHGTVIVEASLQQL